MLMRHMVGYAPSMIVTALTSFASVSIFTGLMSQTDYGRYALAINAMTMIIGVCFFWLQSAASRLMPQAIEQGRQEQLFSTLYGTFAACGLVLMIVAVIVILQMPVGDWRIAGCIAAPLAILRALLNLNQAVHRSYVRIGRYNLIEIGQAVIGLAAAIILILLWHRPVAGAAIGAAIGLATMALVDVRMLNRANWANFDRDIFRDITRFGTPFIVTFGLSFILSGSDRFLIEYFLGADQVGIYSAGYAFPDRIGQNLFMAVVTASFPLVVRRLESEGVEAARDQTYTNGVAILALAVPACMGLVLARNHIAAVLIGQDFRAGAAEIMPWIAVATLFYGLAAHYFDHALHLAKTTRLFFYTLGPSALLNFAANLYAIPRYGIMGAAYTTLVAYALYLALSIIVGRRVFRIKFPVIPALQIAASTAAMAAVLLLIPFPVSAAGLLAMIAVGGIIYGSGLTAFNVMSIRDKLQKSLLAAVRK